MSGIQIMWRNGYGGLVNTLRFPTRLPVLLLDGVIHYSTLDITVRDITILMNIIRYNKRLWKTVFPLLDVY